MAISRLFVEMGSQVDRLNASLRESMKAANAAGVEVTASGQRMLAAFDKALNPTKELAEQIRLLEKAGKSSSDIWKVYGDRMKSAAEAAQKNGQAINPLISQHLSLNKATEGSKLNFENLGRSVQNFASNPVATAQAGITSLASSMGPLAVGMVTAAGAIALAAKELFDLGAQAASEAESLNNLSIATGLRTQELQALAQIAKEAGLESLDLGRTIGKLNEQLGSKEGGDFTKALVANGIALEDSSGKAKSAITLLDELRAQFINISDPVERAQAMQAALGGRLRDLIPLLMQSNEGLAAQIKIMEETGPVWDDITQRKLLAFDKGLDTIGRTWQGIVTDIKAGVGSILGDLTELSQANFNPDKLSTDDKVKFYASMQPGGLKGIPNLNLGPYSTIKVDAESMQKNIKISREVFEAQQKLIAQGADHIALRLKIAEAQKTFDNLLNKGTNEQVAAQARVVQGLNEQLKATIELEKAKKKAQEEEEKRRADQMTDFEFVTKLMELKKKEWDEISKVKLDIPTPHAGWDKPLELPEANFDEITNGINEVSDAFEDYRRVALLTEEAIRAFYVTQKEAALALGEGGFTEIATVALGKFVEDFEGIRVGLADSFGEFFDTLASGFAHAITDSENLGEALKDIGKTAINGLISSIIRLGIQWVIHKTLIKALDKGAMAANAAEAAATATAWAPAAALASLATLGANSAPAMTAIGTTTAMSLGMAQLSRLGSFKEGGYTGAIEPDRIAGIVHGQEFVMNADATREYLPLLKMLNQGRSVGAQMDSGRNYPGWNKPGLTVNIANYGTAKQFEVEQLDEGTIRIIARDEAYSVLSRRGPEVIANDLTYANSKTSKAIARHTTARRGDR